MLRVSATSAPGLTRRSGGGAVSILVNSMKRIVLVLCGLWLAWSSEAAVAFKAAKPVWPQGRELEKNLTVGFRAKLPAANAGDVVVRLTASTLYRLTVNGEFIGHGPARGPHGYYRVDEWPIPARLCTEGAVVAIEVAGYNANSYYLLDQPSFLEAEVVAGEHVLAATGETTHGFEAKLLPERLQKVQRYSFQRPFTEVYRLEPGTEAWKAHPAVQFEAVACAVQPAKPLLARGVPYPDFALRPATALVARGTLRTGLKVDQPWKDRSLTQVGPQLGGYVEKDLETVPSLELQTVGNASLQRAADPALPAALPLGPKEFAIFDLGSNQSGFVGLEVECAERTRLVVTFDEVLRDGDVDFKRLGCVNAVVFELAPGRYPWLESFEPYTFRYFKVMTLEGKCTVRRPALREYVNPDVWRASFACSDDRLNRLFAAARDTYRQNAVDIFMDCPSRERAGWLCDSYWTARSAFDLSGNTAVERNFLENYLLPESFAHLPKGMLPMCYPADHNDGVFIPNWALWFILELDEYVQRSGDRAMAEAFKPRVMALLDYFKPFENSDGLLEKLAGWVFVEWSRANDFVQDVNYPSNMLYARAIEKVAGLYDLPELRAKAARLQETIRRQSFDGTFFVDNALRKDGKLQITTNRTEVCQYFAFYLGTANPQTHAALWSKLVKDFGPKRGETKAFAEIHGANSFIGNVLRLELLSQDGRAQQVLDESIAYLLYMADRTGTLWENTGDYASCNHGFASHALHVLNRDVLGVAAGQNDPAGLTLRFSPSPLDWCRGVIPVPGGRIELAWWKQDGKLHYKLAGSAPLLKVDNRSGLELVREP